MSAGFAQPWPPAGLAPRRSASDPRAHADAAARMHAPASQPPRYADTEPARADNAFAITPSHRMTRAAIAARRAHATRNAVRARARVGRDDHFDTRPATLKRAHSRRTDR